MNNKIFSNGEINLANLYKQMRIHYKFSLKCILISLFLGVLYLLISTPLYKSELTIYPSVNDASSTSGMMGDILDMATNVGIELGNSTMASFSIIDIMLISSFIRWTKCSNNACFASRAVSNTYSPTMINE